MAKWWQKDEREIPRPWGVHEYMSKELGSKTATSLNIGASLASDASTSTASWWRDVEVRRKYAADPAIYDELLNNTEWKSSAARTRDFSTGASHVKYDKEGKMKLQGNQGARYTQGSSPAFDKLLQQFFSEIRPGGPDGRHRPELVSRWRLGARESSPRLLDGPLQLWP